MKPQIKRLTSQSSATQTSRPGTPQINDPHPASNIRFTATLFRPATAPGTKTPSWVFLKLPDQSSSRLPSRGMVSVQGTLNDHPFAATLEPDCNGGHWLKLDRKMCTAANAAAGDDVALDIAPVTQEPEPRVPPDLRKALAAASAQTRKTWSDTTPVARRDWIHWITSGRRAETRAIRIDKACDMLARGKRRPCCFDRSGIVGKGIDCPVADTTQSDRPRSRGSASARKTRSE